MSYYVAQLMAYGPQITVCGRLKAGDLGLCVTESGTLRDYVQVTPGVSVGCL